MYMRYSAFQLEPGDLIQQSGDSRYWIILDGICDVSSGDRFFHVMPHDLLVIPPNVRFSLSSRNVLTVGCITVYDVQARDRGLEQIRNTELVRKVFLFALDLQGYSSTQHASYMNSVSHMMLEALAEAQTVSLDLNPALVQVLNEITAHYRESGFDVNEAIAATGYSKSHFRKIFRQEVGISPLQLITSRRIEYAKSLMRQQKKNVAIKDIAYASGFADAYYFSRQFRAVVGQSPSEYMKSVGSVEPDSEVKTDQ